jgi:hypothetical protein
MVPLVHCSHFADVQHACHGGPVGARIWRAADEGRPGLVWWFVWMALLQLMRCLQVRNHGATVSCRQTAVVQSFARTLPLPSITADQWVAVVVGGICGR